MSDSVAYYVILYNKYCSVLLGDRNTLKELDAIWEELTQEERNAVIALMCL